ncbi:MAG: N-acetyltransferase [Oscillatoriales cyanobacterium]|nr:MAG: N-acetyltransferase [Oscillatoriales cyanobacterium]
MSLVNTHIVLETKRFFLRELTLNDEDFLYEVLSDPLTMQYYPSPKNREETRQWLDRALGQYRESGHWLWAVCSRATGDPVGQCGLIHQVVNGQSKLEIGYLIARRYWGRGYATEAAIACREYAFKILQRPQVISLIHPDNLASRRVAEKVGMTLESEILWRERQVSACCYTVRNPQLTTGSR